MFLYSSLNSPNDPVAGVAFGPSGTAAIGCGKEHLAGKATTFFSTFAIEGGVFQSDAEGERSCICEREGNCKVV
jgi:hypothetical protein